MKKITIIFSLVLLAANVTARESNVIENSGKLNKAKIIIESTTPPQAAGYI